MGVINAKSACCGLGYYGENINPLAFVLTACAILDFWTKANRDNRVCFVLFL
jgi:hypothetical protein